MRPCRRGSAEEEGGGQQSGPFLRLDAGSPLSLGGAAGVELTGVAAWFLLQRVSVATVVYRVG